VGLGRARSKKFKVNILDLFLSFSATYLPETDSATVYAVGRKGIPLSAASLGLHLFPVLPVLAFGASAHAPFCRGVRENRRRVGSSGE
jgi:hypothetical protein